MEHDQQGKVIFVVAMAKNRVIGRDNELPWRLPADIKYFRRVTMGHTILMGRKTHESIGKPLDGRKNVIMTRDHAYQAEGCDVIHSVEEGLALLEEGDLYVVGGAEIYRSFFPYADRLLITMLDIEAEGDTYFPQINEEEWKLVTSEPGETDEKNPYVFSFLTYERVQEVRE